MIAALLGVLITTDVPNHIVLRSSEQISGRSATTCSTRRSGRTRVVPGAGDLGVVLARHEAAARAGGEVDDQVGAARADPLDHLAIELELHRRRAGLRVAHVDVGDRGARLGGLDRGLAICSGVIGRPGCCSGW